MKINQKLWENSFVISTIALLLTLFIGTLDNSRNDYPNYPYYAIAIGVIWVIILIIGMNSYSNEE